MFEECFLFLNKRIQRIIDQQINEIIKNKNDIPKSINTLSMPLYDNHLFLT